jgi:hypothetical protein
LPRPLDVPIYFEQLGKLADEAEGSVDAIRQLGWHALELRLTSEEDSASAAAVIWFQIHHSQLAEDFTTVAFPERLLWSPRTSANGRVSFERKSPVPLHKGASVADETVASQSQISAAARQQSQEESGSLLQEQTSDR